MKKNLPVTQIEEQYSASLNILSTTDLKGAITYVNKDFIDVSGFQKEELLGRNHNMVRHPDMPPAAFDDLWSTVKAGNSWMGIVKNRCKNGNHYWVDAYVSPIERNGQIAEYQSVRRKPAQAYVERAEKIYPSLMQGKIPSVVKAGLSLANKLAITLLLPCIVAIAATLLLQPSAMVASVIFAAGLLLSLIGTMVLMQPFKALVKPSEAVVKNPVAQYIFSGRSDDLGQLTLAMKMLESETAGLVGRIADASGTLTGEASNLSSAVSQSENGVRQQFAEMDQVAAAVNEMSASIQEVASNAQNSSSAAAGGLNEVVKGKEVVNASVASINALKEEIAQASAVISEVNISSNEISAILNVIGEIAEQTNLLALNAAIEAARAGDAGRGFSVVADEVRSLASRTQTSTEEIRQMIERLQTNAAKAVSVMDAGQRRTDLCVEQSDQTEVSLNSILTAIQLINDMNTQIATAVEQQSAVADEISSSVYSIRDMSEQNLDAVESTAKTSNEMLRVSNGFSELAAQFWAKQH
jgi:aerotaxis receptor